MAHYLISFDDGAMDFPEEELPAVAEAAHAVVREAQRAGVWVIGGGLDYAVASSVVRTDGTVTEAREQTEENRLGGFAIVDVPSRDEAHRWAARIAAACRCAQQVRVLMDDPESFHR